jgi:hypothetical protein
MWLVPGVSPFQKDLEDDKPPADSKHSGRGR